jgi:UDP-glucose 4-epimerase
LAGPTSVRNPDSDPTGAAAGDVRRTKADVTKAVEELEWAPQNDLEEGMQTQWEWAAVESPA